MLNKLERLEQVVTSSQQTRTKYLPLVSFISRAEVNPSNFNSSWT